jgi:hypothetical protein
MRRIKKELAALENIPENRSPGDIGNSGLWYKISPELGL